MPKHASSFQISGLLQVFFLLFPSNSLQPKGKKKGYANNERLSLQCGKVLSVQMSQNEPNAPLFTQKAQKELQSGNRLAS